MFGKRKRPSEVAASERAGLLSSWPAVDDSWPRTDQLEGRSALEEIRAGLRDDLPVGPAGGAQGLSLKLLPWPPVSGSGYVGPSHEWIYLTGFVDALADKACGTDRVPSEVKELYPDYHEIDVEHREP